MHIQYDQKCLLYFTEPWLGLVPVLLPLLVLSLQLVPEGVAATAHCALMLEGGRDGATSQAAEVAVATALWRLGDDMVRVLIEGRALVAALEANSSGVLVLAAEEAAGLAAGVAVAGTAHDVADLDPAGLAVPEADANENEEDGADSDGEGDDEILVLDVARIMGWCAVRVEDERNGIARLVDG